MPSSRSARSLTLRWAVASLAALGVVAGLASPASAFCRTTTCSRKSGKCRIIDSCVRTGAPLGWTKMPIPYRFHAKTTDRIDDEEARGAIRLAFARWTEVICPTGKRTSLRFEEHAAIPAKIPRGKEPFGIYFRDDRWPHKDEGATLALTSHLFGVESGEIFYADIEVNTGEKHFVTRDDQKGTDLEAVITHEVGHYIGIDHSPEPDSIMTPSYCESDKRCEESRALARDLGADDVAAVCALYPPDRARAAEPPQESAGCSASPASPAPAGPPAALGAAGLCVLGAALGRFVRAARRR